MVALFGCFALMAARLVVLQVVQFPRYAALAADYRERTITLPAVRGSIFDRDGHSLAVTVDLQAVIADPMQVTDVPKTARELANVLDMKPRKVARILEGSSEGSRYAPVAHELDDATADKVRDLELDGIILQVEPKRFYPGGRLASHILGFVNDYGEALGGIEYEYDNILKGKPGKIVQEQDPHERALPQVGYSEIPAVPGRSLFLTIDKEIQYFTEQTLAAAAQQYHAESGTAIVMRVRTGEILAMASVPDFDPNNFTDFDAKTERRNRAVTDQFEPGSVFKMITAAAALEENLATPETVYSVPDAIQVSDRVINDSHPHPTEDMTFTEVIAQSSNVGTIKIGLDLGKVLLDKWVRRFGFGKETGLDFPGEGQGQVLDLDSWYGSTISQIPIGQGVAVTPIQLVTAYATLGNGGMWVEPKLVHATLDADGGLVPAATPARRRVLSREVASQVLEILTEVVENGTGLEAAVPGYRIAGKTGTAQKPEEGGYGNGYIASFAGVAPSDHPNIAVLVSLDDPSPIWGGSTAAPTFQKIVAFTLRQLGVAPTNNAERDLQEMQEGPEEPVVHD